MKTPPPRSLRLLKADREQVVGKFVNAVYVRFEQQRDTDHKALLQKIWEDVYTPEQQALITQLFKGEHIDIQIGEIKLTDRNNSYRAESINVPRKFSIVFLKDGRGSYQWDESQKASRHYRSPLFSTTEILDEILTFNSSGKNNRAEIETAKAQLSAVLASCKTRAEIEAHWAPIRDLMGDDWVDATEATKVATPNTLPMVKTDAVNRLYDLIKPITVTEEAKAA